MMCDQYTANCIHIDRQSTQTNSSLYKSNFVDVSTFTTPLARTTDKIKLKSIIMYNVSMFNNGNPYQLTNTVSIFKGAIPFSAYSYLKTGFIYKKTTITENIGSSGSTSSSTAKPLNTSLEAHDIILEPNTAYTIKSEIGCSGYCSAGIRGIAAHVYSGNFDIIETTKDIKYEIQSEKIDGGWSDYTVSEWCADPYNEIAKIKERTCNNPTPKNGGENCESSPIVHPINPSVLVPPIISQDMNGNLVNRFEIECPTDGEWTDFDTISWCPDPYGENGSEPIPNIQIRKCVGLTAGGVDCKTTTEPHPMNTHRSDVEVYIENVGSEFITKCPTDQNWTEWVPSNDFYDSERKYPKRYTRKCSPDTTLNHGVNRCGSTDFTDPNTGKIISNVLDTVNLDKPEKDISINTIILIIGICAIALAAIIGGGLKYKAYQTSQNIASEVSIQSVDNIAYDVNDGLNDNE